MAESRQQRRYRERQEAKEASRKPVGKHVRPFRRAQAYALRVESLRWELANHPVELMDALAALPPYKSRGHGWGLRRTSHNARAGRSRYMPHQSARECDRRRVGGFWSLR